MHRGVGVKTNVVVPKAGIRVCHTLSTKKKETRCLWFIGGL